MDGVDSVVQVFPEPSFADKSFEIHVCCADQPYVDGPGLCAPNRDYAPVLDSPQKLCLKVWRNIPYLIKDQCAAVSLLEFADMVGVGIGKGSLDMAEQFAFEQGLGYCTSIDSHHGLPSSGTVGMYFPGQHVLPGTVFSGNQDGGIGRCDLAYCFPDC